MASSFDSPWSTVKVCVSITAGEKKYAKLCGTFKTIYPDAKPEDGPKFFSDGQFRYSATAADNGGLIVHSKTRIGRGRKR